MLLLFIILTVVFVRDRWSPVFCVWVRSALYKRLLCKSFMLPSSWDKMEIEMMYTGLQKKSLSLSRCILAFSVFVVWPYFTFKQPLNSLDESIFSGSYISLFSKSIPINLAHAPAVFMHVCPC